MNFLIKVLFFSVGLWFIHAHADTNFVSYKNYLIPIGDSSVRPDDNGGKPNVIITTDLGGDPDDHQAMVHALLNSDKFNLKGVVASVPTGNISEINTVINAYKKDFNRSSNQINAANGYPNPTSIKIRNGASSKLTSNTPSANISSGAQFIIDTALANKNQPLYILGWGSLTDVAQAVHKNPDIVPFIRLVTVGSTNSGYRACCLQYDRRSRDYLYNNYTDNKNLDENIWWVESETAFRGIYGPDHRVESFESSTFNHVSARGCLGKIWKDNPKEEEEVRPFSGDYIATLYLLKSNRNDPSLASDAGKYYNSDLSRPLYWTERNEDARGTCGEENAVRGRVGNQCWGAGFVYNRTKEKGGIADDFKLVSNRLERNQSYCN